MLSSDTIGAVIRAGLVGIGKMGVSHLSILGAHDDVEMAGVCDSQRFVLSALAANTGIPTYTNADTMFAEAGLDCVIIATPTGAHYEIGAAAIERGISVFIEKPLTLSFDQSTALATAAREAGVANQVGYHNRFIGTFAEVARLVASGVLGDIHHVDGRAFGNVITEQSSGGRTWRSNRSEGGGCLHDYACHVIDLMNFVVGRPSEIAGAQMSSIYSKHTEDAVQALFAYPNGATGLLETNWSDPTYRKMTTSISVSGSNGKVYADRQELRVHLKPGAAAEGYDEGWTVRYITELQPPVDFYVRGEEYSAQLDAFISACGAGASSGVNDFASAADTDWVVGEIQRVEATGIPSRSATGAHETPAAPSFRSTLRPRIDDAGKSIRQIATRLWGRLGEMRERRR